MFERILFAYDGSDESERAVPVVMDLARCGGASVTLLHVREHELGWGVDVDVETSGEASELVDGVVRRMKDEGVDVRGEIHRVVAGLVGHDILATAREVDAELIVIGSRGLSAWSGLLGSVAHKVLHTGDRPVLVIR